MHSNTSNQYIWNDYHTSIPTSFFEICYSIYIVQSTVKMEETKEDKANNNMQAFQRKRISEKTYNLNFFFDKIVLLRCWLFLCGLIAQKIRNENWHIFYVVVFIYIGVKKIFLYLTRLYFSQLLYQSWLSPLVYYTTVSYEILVVRDLYTAISKMINTMLESVSERKARG